MNNDKEAQEDPDFTNNLEDYYYQFVGGEDAVYDMGELIKVKLDDTFMTELEEIKLSIDVEEKSINKDIKELASMDIFGSGYDESKKNEDRKDYFDDALSRDSKFRYMLLSRMIEDCKYFIEHPHNKHLWAETPEDQIQLMKELYNSFEEKPEWTSLEEIEELAKSMGVD